MRHVHRLARARTWNVETERVLAWVIVAIAHAMLGWLLFRASAIHIPSHDASTTMQLTWLAPAPLVTPKPLAPRRVPDPKPVTHALTSASVPARPDSTAAVDAAPEPAAPMSAVFIHQIHQSTAEDADGTTFALDPLSNRPIVLPGKVDGPRLVYEKTTVQDVARGIGQLFGGRGYTDDPCPQIRRNIANNRALGGDEALLAEELHRQSSYCH